MAVMMLMMAILLFRIIRIIAIFGVPVSFPFFATVEAWLPASNALVLVTIAGILVPTTPFLTVARSSKPSALLLPNTIAWPHITRVHTINIVVTLPISAVTTNFLPTPSKLILSKPLAPVTFFLTPPIPTCTIPLIPIVLRSFTAIPRSVLGFPPTFVFRSKLLVLGALTIILSAGGSVLRELRLPTVPESITGCGAITSLVDLVTVTGVACVVNGLWLELKAGAVAFLGVVGFECRRVVETLQVNVPRLGNGITYPIGGLQRSAVCEGEVVTARVRRRIIAVETVNGQATKTPIRHLDISLFLCA